MYIYEFWYRNVYIRHKVWGWHLLLEQNVKYDKISTQEFYDTTISHGTKYSRINQVKFVKDNL